MLKIKWSVAPATIGSLDTPSPTGTYKVTGVAPNPWYSYSPSNFVQGKNLKALSLPPGPNGPVGNIWIGLSKKSLVFMAHRIHRRLLLKQRLMGVFV